MPATSGELPKHGTPPAGAYGACRRFDFFRASARGTGGDVALSDKASAETLVARVLPFIGNRQEDVAGLTLVYRTGAFAVFELAPA